MRKISKIVFCLVSIFSLNACKGTEISKEDFCRNVELIDDNFTFTTITVSFSEIHESDSAKYESKGEGKFARDSDNQWKPVDEDANNNVTSYFYTYILIFGCLKEIVRIDRLRLSYSARYEDVKEKYFVNPFGFEVECTDKDGKVKCTDYFEWNYYGYLTKFESKGNDIKEDITVEFNITFAYK